MLPRFANRETSLVLALCGLVFAAPLPSGSVTPPAEMAFRLTAFGLFVLAMATGADRARLLRGLPVVAFAGLALLGLVQSCSWPAAAAGTVSPEHVRLAREAGKLVDASPPSFVALSLEARSSRSAALSWLAGAALLVVILVAAERRSRRRWLGAALITAALVQVLLGLLRLYGDSAGELGAVLLRPEGRLRGTYANPNHLSLFFEIVMAPVFAWTWLELSRLGPRPLRGYARALVPALVWLALLAGVVLTGSRAGLMAAVLGAAVQVVAVPFAGRGRRSWLAAALVFVLSLAFLAAIGSGVEIRRYATVSVFEDNLRSRMLVVPPALELWRRFPATGTGLGTFEDAFPMVATRELEPVLWNRAHNDPLELLVTGGAVGFALGLLALIALLPPIWQGLRHGDGSEERAAGLAALGAVAAVGLHELFDFGLVIPANALALLLVLGSAVAASPTERRVRD